jgi:hypothetical protein
MVQTANWSIEQAVTSTIHIKNKFFSSGLSTMTEAYATMCEIRSTTKINDENIRPSRRVLSGEDRFNNDMVINSLRIFRESRFSSRNKRIFGRRPLRLAPTLPLPDLEHDSGSAPWLLSIEHLQDFCNKSTAIYCTDILTDFTPMYEFIFKKWSPGDVHKLDIEFARFFAKLVGVTSNPSPTTQQIIMLHEALCDASRTAHGTGFVKEDNWDNLMDIDFIGGHQVEFYNIKPLLRALIIVIDKRNPRNEPNFEKQEVRLVRTGATTGLRQPIAFDGLTVLDKINENEVVTTLPEAVRFVMDLDGREEALLEKRDMRILDHWLGLPKVQIQRYFSEPNGPRYQFWTGEDADIPVGPSTNWWKDGLMDKDRKPIKMSLRGTQ